MLRSTRRGLETWHGRDRVTLADERARQQGTQTSTYTGAPVLDPTWERPEVKFLRATRQSRRTDTPNDFASELWRRSEMTRGANRRHMQCSKPQCYSITSAASAINLSGTVR